MRSEQLRQHIHNELFGVHFPVTPQITEWKKNQKGEIIMRSVGIMRRNGHSENEIQRMLMDKFFLTEKESERFMEKEG